MEMNGGEMDTMWEALNTALRKTKQDEETVRQRISGDRNPNRSDIGWKSSKLKSKSHYPHFREPETDAASRNARNAIQFPSADDDEWRDWMTQRQLEVSDKLDTISSQLTRICPDASANQSNSQTEYIRMDVASFKLIETAQSQLLQCLGLMDMSDQQSSNRNPEEKAIIVRAVRSLKDVIDSVNLLPGSSIAGPMNGGGHREPQKPAHRQQSQQQQQQQVKKNQEGKYQIEEEQEEHSSLSDSSRSHLMGGTGDRDSSSSRSHRSNQGNPDHSRRSNSTSNSNSSTLNPSPKVRGIPLSPYLFSVGGESGGGVGGGGGRSRPLNLSSFTVTSTGDEGPSFEDDGGSNRRDRGRRTSISSQPSRSTSRSGSFSNGSVDPVGGDSDADYLQEEFLRRIL